MSNIVIAIDPGLTTGIVVASNIVGDKFDIHHSVAMLWPDRFNLQYLFQSLLEQHTIEAVVIERFALFPSKALAQSYSDFPSVQIIALCEAYLHQLDMLDKIVMQSPDQRKRVAFEKQHYPQVRATLHQRDAYQHLRYYIVTQAFKAWKDA